MDSTDLEREKGITILAKNTAVRLGDTKINIVDTPGHADFGGEVERGLTMVDGVLLLVDASRGAAAADAVRAAQGARAASCPSCSSSTRSTGPTRAPHEVVNEVYELFLDLDADESQIEFPIVYANARAGHAGLGARRARSRPAAALRHAARDDPGAVATTPTTRCRRSSRTSTRARTSAGSRCCGSTTARCARARRSRGAAPTGRSRTRA